MDNFLIKLIFAQEQGITVRELQRLPPLTTGEIIVRYINFFSLFLVPIVIVLLILGLMRLTGAKSDQVKIKNGKRFLIIAVFIFAIWIISSLF